MMNDLLFTNLWLLKSTLLLVGTFLLHLALSQRVSAAFRHMLWMIGFMGMLIIPLASFFANEITPDVQMVIPVSSPSSLNYEPTSFTHNTSEDQLLRNKNILPFDALEKDTFDSPSLRLQHWFQHINWFNWFYYIWLCGVVIYIIRLIVEKIFLIILQRKSKLGDEQLAQMLGNSKAYYQINRMIRIVISKYIDIPFTAGYFKPVIYIPTNYISNTFQLINRFVSVKFNYWINL